MIKKSSNLVDRALKLINNLVLNEEILLEPKYGLVLQPDPDDIVKEIFLSNPECTEICPVWSRQFISLKNEEFDLSSDIDEIANI